MKNRYRISFLFILVYFSTLFWRPCGGGVCAQNKNIDSLLILLKKDKSDTNKVIHLNQLSSEYEFIGDFEKGLSYGANSLELARKLIFKKGIANAHHNIGNIYDDKDNYPDALKNYFASLKIREEIGDKKGISASYGSIGIVYKEQGDYPKALEYYFKALKLFEELGDKNTIAKTLGNIGIVYRNQEDYLKALEYYFKALKLEEEGGKKKGIEAHLVNIGNVYLSQAELILSDKAEVDTPSKKVEYLNKALDFYLKALKIDEAVGDRNRIAICLGNIGNVYKDRFDYPQALDCYFKSLQIKKEIGDKKGIAITLGNIGWLYTTTGKFKEAEQYLKRSLAIDDSIGALTQLMGAEGYLSRLYEKTDRHKLALVHYKRAMAIKDTLFSQENKKQLVRKEMNYEFDKKEAITKAENEKQQAIAEEKNRRQKIITWSVAFGLLLVLVFAGFVFRSLKLTGKQKQIIEIKNTETEHQKKIIEEKNKDITDSIRYAKRIQDALMGEKEHVSVHLPEHFILFIPKDIVSGDFHWGVEKKGYWYFAAVDCTGHGVPGAIMSMLGISFLNDIVSSEELLSPAEILDRLRDKVVKELRQKGEAGGSKDGMDISLCRLELPALQENYFRFPSSRRIAECPKADEAGREREVRLQWAGANNSLNLIRNGKLEEIKPDKQPIGYHPEQYHFTNHELQLQKGDCIYIYSDGYADQFGGANGKKFKYKQLEDLIIVNNHLPMKEQKEILKKSFIEWKGSLEQVDDVCIFGVRV